MKLTRKILARMTWRLHEKNPLVGPPFLSPIIADPSVLPPEESPDGRWHLFAHAVHGIYHLVSTDGIAWHTRRLLFRNAMRPFIFRQGDTWHLFYERYRAFHIYLSMLPMRWSSRIEVRSSPDLVRWSAPSGVLSPSLPWHRDPLRGDSVSNPCVVKTGDGFVLYYSASLVRVDDCGFNEPLHIGRALSDNAAGPYRPETDPILSPDPGDRWCNLGCGSVKVLRAGDGFVGFQNGIYVDPVSGHSGSAILLLGSADGVRWERIREEPAVRPGEGWMKSHVYACHPVPMDDGTVFLYFNARNDWHWTKGKEAVGLAIGR